MTTVLLVLTIAVIGIATVPRKLLNTDYVYIHGLLTFIVATSVISSNLRISAGLSSLGVLLASIVLLLYRYYSRVYFYFYLRRFSSSVIVFLFIALIYELLQNYFKFDLAGRNFDAIYAIQDGAFLENAPTNTSISSVETKEILPLQWSASNADRYGMSLLISFIRFLNIGDGWTNAQSIYFVMLALTFLTIRGFILEFFRRNKLKSTIYAVLIMFSPMIVFQHLYFMFGQSIALPTLTFIFFLATCRRIETSQIYWAFVLAALFVSYPAALFPAIGLFFIQQVVRSKNAFREILTASITGLLFFLILSLSYGSGSKSFFRIWNWTVGVLNPNLGNVSESEAFRIPIFSQFSSLMGMPISAGLISYPDLHGFSLWRVILTNLITILYVIFTAYFWLRTNKDVINVKLFSLLLLIPVLFLFYGFVSPKQYVLVKTLIWFSPLFGIVQTVAFDHLWSGLRSNQLSLVSVVRIRRYLLNIFMIAVTLIFLFMQTVTSWSYLTSLKSWDSFLQRPQFIDYDDFLRYRESGIKSIAVVSATAEESAWIAGLLDKSSLSVYSLGIKDQALGEALSRNCSLTFAQKNFQAIDSLLINSRLQDISTIFKFKTEPYDSIRNWRFFRARDLNFAVLVNGSGTFPPTIVASNASPIDGERIFRWSSNQICLGIYSDLEAEVGLNIKITKGPDLPEFKEWQVNSPTAMTKFLSDEDHLHFIFKAHKGWNRLQIKQTGCDTNVSYDRWFARPDDRKLCFAVGKITVFQDRN